jgi:hypothetical protein
MNKSYISLEDEEESLPVCEKLRISDAHAAHTLWQDLKQADSKASAARAHIESMLSGDPPWTPQVLENAGQADKCNLNFQEGKAVIDAAMTPFYDLTNSSENLITCEVTEGDPHLRQAYALQISKEFTKTVKTWPGFEFNRQLLSREFVVHGIGVAYFNSTSDFRFSVAGLLDWKIPRKTPADIEQIPYVGIYKEYPVDELFGYIKDPEIAMLAGWKVGTVKNAIKKAIENKSGKKYETWEQIEQQMLQDDLLTGRSLADIVRVVHMYVKEFSGKITHLIICEDEPSDFLYFNAERFENLTEAMVIFAYGVGKGYYHTIRGAGDMIYSIVQTQNRLRCQAYDCANGAASVMLQPEDSSGRALEDMSLTQFGPFQILPPGVKVVDRALPNLAHSVLPIINDMSSVLRQVTGHYQQRASSAGSGPEKKVLEIQLDAQREAALSNAAINLFYGPLDSLYEEMFKRISRPNYYPHDPDYKYVNQFRKGLLKRGVPLVLLGSVIEVKASRSIGGGSASNRTLALTNALQFSGSMPEAGRVNLIRDIIATNMDYDQIDRYLPAADTEISASLDRQLAEFESNFMRQKMKSSVLSGQNHTIHLKVHMLDAEAMMAMLQNGSVSPVDMLAYLSLLVPHCQEHLSKVSSDATNAAVIGTITQRVQQLSASAERLNNEIMAAMEAQKNQEEAEMQRMMAQEQARIAELEQKAAAAESGGEDKVALKLQKEIMAFQTKMELEKQAFAQKLAQRDAEFKQKLLFKDLETSKILNNKLDNRSNEEPI